MRTTRRQFLKLAGALAGATVLPVTLGTTIVLEPVIDYALLEQAISIGGMTKNMVQVDLDLDKMWQSIHLADQHGHEWRTHDQGHTWSWNGHSFTADGICTSAS